MGKLYPASARRPHADFRVMIGKMSESPRFTSLPAGIGMPDPELPESRSAGARQVAIVGLNRETASLLPNLLDAEGITVIKVLNPEFEEVSRLTAFPHLDVIIDTTRDPAIAARLRKLPLKKVDVISGLGARLLFCSIRDGRAEGKDGVLHSLEQIREAVCLAKDKSEILKVILNTAIKIARADCGSLMLLDPSKRQLTIEASCGLDESVVVSSIQRVGKGVSGYAVRRREAVLINGAVDRQTYAADYNKPEIVSSICCPLVAGDEAVGVINIASKTPGRVFDAGDVAYLEELARLTAEVLKTARDAEGAGNGSQSLGLLSSIHGILAMKYRFEERLNLLLMKMANAFDAKACTFYEYNPGERCFVAKASSSVGAGLLKERPMLLDDFFAQRLLKTGTAFCVNSAGKGPRAKKWYMLQPIRNGAKIAGALLVYLHSERNHVKEESGLLKRIGDLLARELSRNREMETIKIQSLRHSAISQFSADMESAAGLEEVTRMILSNVRVILEAETCILRLSGDAEGELRVADTLSHRNPVWMKDILTLDARIASDLSGGVAGEKDRCLKIDKLSESVYGSDLQASESVLGMALSHAGAVLGTLTLYDRKSLDPAGPRRFSDEDADVMVNFCRQAAKGLARVLPIGPAKDTQIGARQAAVIAESM